MIGRLVSHPQFDWLPWGSGAHTWANQLCGAGLLRLRESLTAGGKPLLRAASAVVRPDNLGRGGPAFPVSKALESPRNPSFVGRKGKKKVVPQKESV